MPDQDHDQVVLFDAVGTVIRPVPDVVSVYENLGRASGSRLTRDELKRRIGWARQKFFNVYSSSKALEDIDRLGLSGWFESAIAINNVVSSDEIELQLWRQLVVEVFKDVPDSNRLFEKLWEHFRLPQHWQLYDDSAVCWDRLRKQGCMIGLASNFDSRLLQLCDSIPLLNTADFVFQSAGVGFRKPSPMFYQTIENEILGSTNLGDSSPSTIYMVGDDLVNDCLAPARHGWSGFWLNRDQAQSSNAVPEVASLVEFAGQITS